MGVSELRQPQPLHMGCPMSYETLRRVSFCAGLPESALRDLAAIAARVAHDAGAMIQIEGGPAEAMYVVAAGRVKICRIAATRR